MSKMETFKTDAINLKTYPISENDNIVVMFSKELGLIKGVAKGVKRPKSKLGARMQALVCNSLVLNHKKTLDTIKEASALNPFNKLRYDFDKLTMALYVVETVNTFCINENKDKEQNEIIYNLIYKTLENIQNSTNEIETILSGVKFQLWFMKEIGFGIEFERCLKCSKKAEETVLFSPQTGGITCLDCGVENVQYIKLHSKIKDFLLTLNNTPIDIKTRYDELANFKVTNSCFNLLKKYIEITSNKKSKAAKIIETSKVS